MFFSNVFSFSLSVVVVCISLSSPNTHSTPVSIHRSRVSEREKQKDSFYYKALIFLELFFIQAAVFVRKTHNFKFFVLEKVFFFFFSFLIFRVRSYFLNFSSSGVVENYFLCVYYYSQVESVLCVLLPITDAVATEENSKINSDFFSSLRFC